MISRLLGLGVIACLCAGALPDKASAQRAFDGEWSVLIATERGPCDRAYRFGISIAGGVIYYYGGAGSFSGRVSANGAIRVRATSAGGGVANGSGRLHRNTGGGRWSGQSGGDRCSGYWTAERRG